MNIERLLLVGLMIGAVIGSVAYSIVTINNLQALLEEEQQRVVVMSMICGMPPPVRVPLPGDRLDVLLAGGIE